MNPSSLLALFAAVPVPTAPLPPGRYCLVVPLTANTGRYTYPLGDFYMQVDVRNRGSSVIVKFKNSMPDSGQFLLGYGQARPARDGSVRFPFEDNWGNRGKAKLTRDGMITLTEVARTADTSWGRNAGRNYGSFQVTKRGCAARIRTVPQREALDIYTVSWGQPRK